MARRYRRNPSFLGHRVEDVLVKASGAALTQFVDQQFAQPLTSRVLPTSGAAGRAVDALSTAVSAKVAGMAVGLASREYGQDVEDGGFILAGAKAINVLIPGVNLTATYPDVFNRFGIRPRPSALPAATAVPAGATSTTLALPAGNGATAYAQPAVVTDDAGI